MEDEGGERNQKKNSEKERKKRWERRRWKDIEKVSSVDYKERKDTGRKIRRWNSNSVHVLPVYGVHKRAL